MKTDLNTIRDTFKISYDTYYDSRLEGEEVDDMYHNRQYNREQLATLANRGQPAETFNVIKLFGRLLLGYYSTVVNTVKVSPEDYVDIDTANLLNDVVSYVMRTNHMETEGDKIKLDGLLAGLMCCYIDVIETGRKDRFGRTIKKIVLSHVPWQEICLDPMSKLEDYSDARFIHRWKWVTEEALRTMFPNKKEVIDELEAYENHLNINEAEFEDNFGKVFDGDFKRFNNYCLVHTIITDEVGKSWSIFWCGEKELKRSEVTHKEVKNPYRVHKLNTSRLAEHYGIFREVVESQKAVNQAILKIQLMANTQKIIVEDKVVDDIEDFADKVNRVNGILQVKNINKIRIENMTKEIADQYVIIEKAFARIQRVLGINDSFLGMAFASDSGRKVKLQQNSTTLSLRYLTVRIEQFYRLMGWDCIHLIKQYYTAEQTLRITDDSTGERWVALNQPMTMWSGEFDENGQPIMQFVWEEVLNPATNKPELDEKGNYIIAPIPTRESEVAFTDVEISIDSAAYNDEDEKNQLMLETVLQGNIGGALSEVNPAGYFKAASLTVKSMKTKYSPDISGILGQTAEMIAGGAVAPPSPVDRTTPASPKSQALKLPQNTNEGVAG
ncbi:MAG: hypothetical protein COV55_02915 [Candidatus Komeilibacteria bacterium CG11_big_fil_rev_8_21_14_0_20_36_20]|uniref:Portal protein n=1 Tax=Candidatus Komeilibacteria bacterium CG11_big_fil_rev_8_21_14_0_20_36_20 TaxID=1974477 RepID=A0A2H0NCQ5_9BACT|nr:MAG: hypothetical protein COV55_02915 [Candidatus Komeilibacteria bacterium CG11_big_fil_rev_8_21_14_0_20_36_20]